MATPPTTETRGFEVLTGVGIVGILVRGRAGIDDEVGSVVKGAPGVRQMGMVDETTHG